ncbi:MAG: EAL domain-containing protein [Lysobacter sp.]|nr:EAL domain-containing protein [Lysobacter sp.]
MQSHGNGETRAGEQSGLDPASALLATQSPAALATLLGTLHPALGERVEAVLWSAHWPQRLAARPVGALSEAAATRAVREISARRAGGRPDPRFALLCDDRAADVGMLILREPLPPDPTLGGLLAQAGTRMAELLERERLQESVTQLEDAERLQRALYAIADMAGSDFDMPDLLRGLHRIVSDLMYAENFYIALYEEEQDSLRFVYFADTVDTLGPSLVEPVPMAAIERGLTWYLVRDGRPLMGTTEQLQQQVSGPLALHGADSVDWLGVPMLREGHVIGALVVQSYLEGTRYTHADMSLLAFVAEHVLTALERKRSQEELEQRVAERTRELATANTELSREVAERERGERLQAALYQIAALAGSDESAETFYRHVHEIVGSLIDAENFFIALLSDDGERVSFPYGVDRTPTDWRERPFGHGFTEYVIRTGRTQLIDRDGKAMLLDAGEVDAQRVADSVLWLGAPMLDFDRPIGVVAVQSYARTPTYDERDVELLTYVSYQIAASLQRRRAAEALKEANARLEERVELRTRELREQIAQRELIEAQLKHQVMHDALTGLPNRVYLRDRIERAIAQVRRDPARNFALLYIDVDRFKQINDSLGHLAGDHVLKEVSRRLESVVRDPDVVARLSGDEFAVLLESVDLPETATKVAQRIIALQETPIEFGDHLLQCSASIGVAIGDRRYHSVDTILRDADIALYRAKQHGRNRFVLFDDHLHRAAMEDLALEQELRAEDDRHAFVPWFQPLVRLEDASVAGYEALLRWQHPQRGVLAPADFLQVAEDSGLIEQIDWQVFRHACDGARQLLLPGQFVAINVTQRLLRLRDFDIRLLKLLDDSGLPRTALRIEVTEDALFGDPESVAAILRRLRAAGVETVLDDFGTGTSALGSVHAFPLRMVKIDREVIAQLDRGVSHRGRATVGAVLALTQALGMDAVAEGVETDTQRAFLSRMGCRYGQGHLFGRAQPLAFWLQRR